MTLSTGNVKYSLTIIVLSPFVWDELLILLSEVTMPTVCGYITVYKCIWSTFFDPVGLSAARFYSFSFPGMYVFILNFPLCCTNDNQLAGANSPQAKRVPVTFIWNTQQSMELWLAYICECAESADMYASPQNRHQLESIFTANPAQDCCVEKLSY